jgi:A/G-specific adenine glycosylase
MTASTFPTTTMFDWYDRHGRSLPWRHRWPDLAPAYHVWLSEIMLQQTVVTTVIPYFLEFTRRWPNVCDLAAAEQDEVMAAWAGLGYYARARNLHRAARIVCGEHAGRFPDEVAGLRGLPGIGPYTAGAIAAIAFGRRSTVVDGNIERVLARYFAIATPLPAAKPEIGVFYDAILPSERPSDFPQALMDFANAVCTPRNPGCETCPLAEECAARHAGTPESWPVKAPKKIKPERSGIAFVAIAGDGQAFMVTRPERGMLGGMLAFPSAGWTQDDAAYDADSPFASAPFAADWRLAGDSVSHVFTHFSLSMDVAVAGIEDPGPATDWHRVRPASLPTLMRKVWTVARREV